MVIEAANAVGQTVTDQVSLTEKFLNNFRTFAETRGIDIAEAIIVFIIGYIICREIKKWVKHLLGKSNIDPTAIGFITEMIYFFSNSACYFTRGCRLIYVFFSGSIGRYGNCYWVGTTRQF